MSVEPRLTFSLIESSRRKSKDGADIVIEGHGLKLDDRDAVHLFVDLKRDPFGIGRRQTIHVFGCDVKENTDTRLVVAFPTSPVLTPDLVLGQPGQVAHCEFSKTTKKNARQHGRRADVTFAE